MGDTSLQVCMDSSDWLLQGRMNNNNNNNNDENMEGETRGTRITAVESWPSSPTSTGEDPLLERRLMRMMMRPPPPPPPPPQEQVSSVKCPRCESRHTKFCYYNNYSLSQPRYLCKGCRRYWTKGGTLRNIPVGGASRKSNSKSKTSTTTSTTKSSSLPHHILSTPDPHHHHLHHHFNSSLLSSPTGPHNNIDHFLETKLEGILGITNYHHHPHHHDVVGFFTGPSNLNHNNINHNGTGTESTDYLLGVGGGGEGGGGLTHHNGGGGGGGGFGGGSDVCFNSSETSCERLMLPYHDPHYPTTTTCAGGPANIIANYCWRHDHGECDVHNNDDVKPTTAKLLTLDTWHHQDHDDDRAAASTWGKESSTPGYHGANWNFHQGNNPP